MKLLVTGGLGFIGLNYVLQTAHKHEITVLDKQTYAANPTSLLPDGVKFIRGDVSSINKLGIEPDFDWIIHFAAESHVDNALTDATPFWESNVQGTYELTLFALKYHIKFFHVSTDEVFGEWLAGEPEFTEQSPYRPNNMYAVSKAASDQIVRAQHRSFGLQYVITNCGNNYGQYQHNEKFIPRVKSGRIVELHANGSPVRDWINVKDHCSAINCLLAKAEENDLYLPVMNNSFVVGARDAHSIRDICNLAGASYRSVEGRPGVDFGYKLNPAKLEALGWRPKYKVKDYL